MIRCLIPLLCCLASFALNAAPTSFAEAKRLAWPLYAKQSTEFYCGCKYSGNRVDLRSCGYSPRKNAGRVSASVRASKEGG